MPAGQSALEQVQVQTSPGQCFYMATFARENNFINGKTTYFLEKITGLWFHRLLYSAPFLVYTTFSELIKYQTTLGTYKHVPV